MISGLLCEIPLPQFLGPACCSRVRCCRVVRCMCAVLLPLARAVAPCCGRCRGSATAPGACAHLGAASVSGAAARVCDDAPVGLPTNVWWPVGVSRAPLRHSTPPPPHQCCARCCRDFCALIGGVVVTCPALGMLRHSPGSAMLAIAS